MPEERIAQVETPRDGSLYEKTYLAYVEGDGCGGCSAGGSSTIEELFVEDNTIYDPNFVEGNMKTVFFTQDAIGGHFVSLENIKFTGLQVDVVSEHPNATSSINIVMREDGNWYCVGGVERGYDA